MLNRKLPGHESRRRTWFYICTGDRVPYNKYRLVKARRRLGKNELVTVDDVEGGYDEEKEA